MLRGGKNAGESLGEVRKKNGNLSAGGGDGEGECF